MTRAFFIFIFALLLLPVVSRAATLPEVAGAPDSPNPFSARLLSPGLSAAYFNPALLTTQRPGFTSGFILVSSQLDITLMDRGPGYDIHENIFESRPLSGFENMLRPLPTDRLRARRGSWNPTSNDGFALLGSQLSFLDDRLAVGFLGIFPLGAFQEQAPFFSDEREQYFSNSLHFELFEDRLKTNLIVLALAGRVTRDLHLGGGVTITNTARTEASIFMPDASRQDESHMNTRVSVNTKFLPHLGLAWRPWQAWTFTSTVHFPSESRTDGESEIQFWNYQPEEGEAVVQRFSMIYGYEPLRVHLGAAFGRGGPRDLTSVAISAQWERWSTYLDRHGEKPRDPWSDTVRLTLGLRQVLGMSTVGVDAAFIPTPIPDQTGRSSYVDNHRLAFALGWESRAMAHLGITAGLSAQLHWLLPRETVKDLDAANPVFDEYPDSSHIFTGDFIPESAGFQTNNPGFPGFSSDGFIIAIMAYMRIATN